MKNFANPADKASLSHRFRSKRDAFLRDFLIDARSRGDGPCRIVDLGGGAAYWQRVGFDWLAEHGFQVDCVNLEVTELTRDTDTASPVRLIEGNACNMQDFADQSYDIVHSNSVIEHVGRWDEMRQFAGEVRRLAPNYYVQTPYFWSPVDPHFYRLPMIHWLPASLRAKLHMRLKAGWAPRAETIDDAMTLAESNYMLDRRQFKWLFPDAAIRPERVVGLTKSLIATRLDVPAR